MAWLGQRLADTAATSVGGIAEAPDVAALPPHARASSSDPLVAIAAAIFGLLALAASGLWYARGRRA
jgi:hypothetical protein